MTVIVFEPHEDDAVLFAAYTIMREQLADGDVWIVTVLNSSPQREQESSEAADLLGVSYEAWTVHPSEDQVLRNMRSFDDGDISVWVPLWEAEGHEHHNLVSQAAQQAYGDRCRFYATYRRGNGRSQTSIEMLPQPDWPAAKIKAMSCYVSQINDPGCRPWFNQWDREWIA